MTHERPLSYAQNMEDYHLSLAFAGQDKGTYIDIGGGHPVAGSVSFWFYMRGWNGIVVEPQDGLAQLHRALRPNDHLAQCLIGAESGERNFHQFDRLHGLSTTVDTYAKAVGSDFRTTRLQAMSLADLCRAHVQGPIDFLKIDVEGAEGEVIAGADWQRFRPGIVLLESIAPISNEPAWQAWEGQLLSKGYRFALFDTLNRFYVAEERKDLLARMPTERAPWDAVRHLYEIGRAPDNASHPDHALALDLARGFWASLPFLSDDILAEVLEKGRALNGTQNKFTREDIASDPFRGSLGLIASAYDGGFIDD